MLPPSFIVLVALSTGLPFIGTLLFVVAISSSEWEDTRFHYDKIGLNQTAWSVTGRELFSRDNPTERVGVILTNWNNTVTSCLYNFKAGIWQLCDSMIDIDRSEHCAQYDVKQGKRCFYYITDFSLKKDSITKHGQFVIKMQNNIISCVIVVLLCVGASIMIGITALVGKIVPAAMVTGVLYLTAGLFVFFANCIQYIKVDKIRTTAAFCYPVISYPEGICMPDYMEVRQGWPNILSWISAVVFGFACAFWLYLTRLMRIETAKNML